MPRLRLLDVFCGAGGASVGYHAAGFDVTGVDLAPQPDYPFPFIQADALDLLADPVFLAGFDVVHASPPCQRWSAATPAETRLDHPDLIDPVRELLEAAVSWGRPWGWVMENVPGAPLVDPVVMCGDTLRLGVRRHRLFESNCRLVGTGCHHDRHEAPVPVYGSYGQRGTVGAATSVAAGRHAMGIDWMPWPALTQAIPPAYTFWIGAQLRAVLGIVQVGNVTGAAADSSRLVDADSSRLAGAESSRPPAGSVITTRAQSSQVVGVSLPSAGRCPCGAGLPPRPASGRWPRYCSHACRQAAYRRRTRTAGER